MNLRAINKPDIAVSPCSFCGELPISKSVSRSEIGHLWWVSCKNCLTEGPAGTFEDNAIELWNNRHNAAKKRPATFEDWLGAEKLKEYDRDLLAMMKLAWEAGHL